MKTIHKFPIRIEVVQDIAIPAHSTFIHAGLDPQGQTCLWAEVETTNEKFPKRVYLLGTGHPIPEGARSHIGSFKQGNFMWHIYSS